MKFGIFHELSVAKPWHARSEYEVYHNALEQVELADELGFDQAGAGGHHSLGGAVPSPETGIQAAERGIGCLGVSIGTPKEYEQRVKDYRRVVRKCEPVGEFVNEQVNGVTFLYVGETDEEASEWGTRLAMTFSY